MHVYLKDHFIFLFASFVVGIFLCISYEVFRVLRVARGVRYNNRASPEFVFEKYKAFRFYNARIKKSADKKRRFISETLLTFIEDIFYSIILTVSVLVLVYGANYGIPRFFSFAGIALGFVLCRITVGKVLILFSEYICYFVGAVFFYLLCPFIFLFTKTKKVIYKCVLFVYNKYIHAKIRKKSIQTATQLSKSIFCFGNHI